MRKTLCTNNPYLSVAVSRRYEYVCVCVLMIEGINVREQPPYSKVGSVKVWSQSGKT